MTCHSFKGNLRSVRENKDLNNREKNLKLYIDCHKEHIFACALIVFPFETRCITLKSQMRKSSDISDPQQCVASPSADWRFVRHLCGCRVDTAPMGCTGACLSPSQELCLHLWGLHIDTWRRDPEWQLAYWLNIYCCALAAHGKYSSFHSKSSHFCSACFLPSHVCINLIFFLIEIMWGFSFFL